MSNPWLSVALPVGLALSSWAGFALGTLPFRVRSSHDSHDLAEAAESSVTDHLYPVTVAFFLGYLAVMAIPHAVDFGSWTSLVTPLIALGVGAAAMAFLSRKVFHRDPCCETGHTHDPLGWAFFLALSVCAINDGILIGLIDPLWFSGLNLGMIVHKITSSFALAVALGHWHYKGRRLLVLGVINGLISPVMFYVGQGLRGVESVPLEGMLGFSLGILIYTVCTGMLPHSGEMLKRKPKAWIGFGVALVVAVALGLLHRSFH
jgi:zinc transporter ZupT